MQPGVSRDDIHQKVGRNVLRFQLIELVLKSLLTRSNVAGYVSDKEVWAKRVASVEHVTMGQAAKRLLEEIYSKSPCADSAEVPEDLKRPWLSYEFREEADDTYREQMRSCLALLVADRNELVHRFLDKFDIMTDEGAEQAAAYLDRQYEKAESALDWVRVRFEAMRRGAEVSAEFMASDLGMLLTSPIVGLLDETAKQYARPDGWVELSAAGQVIAQRAPGELKVLRERFANKSLKQLVGLIGWFELRDERTPKGGVRTLFRSDIGKTLEIAVSDTALPDDSVQTG